MLLALVEAFLVVLVEFLASIQPLEECGWRDIPDTYMAPFRDVLLASRHHLVGHLQERN